MHQDINNLFRISVVFLLGSLFSLNAATNHKNPNIILILADDLGIGDIGINGSSIKTPNIDRMVREGAYLTNFYASANVCSPSRAGLLTGRYPIRMGLAHDVIQPDSEHGLPQSETTIAEFLKQQAYATAMIGKWHLGHKDPYWPTMHGFDYFYGLPYSNDMQPLSLYRNNTEIENPVDQSTLTQRYTDETIKFIRKNSKSSFFIYLPHTFPHIPLHASEKFRGKSIAGIYGDTVEELDWSVGEIIRTLEEHSLTQNTLVLFTSDNGAWFEGSNAHLRDMKGLTWDGGYRVPLVAWWPGKIPAGIRSDAISMNTDIFPTIAAVINKDIDGGSELDGKNIWALLKGASASPHEHLLLFNNEDIAAVRTQDWKYLVRGYYKKNYVAFDRLEKAFGFTYPLLFDMREMNQERYSKAHNFPGMLAYMKELLASARDEFGPMRTRPAEEAFPE